MTKRPGDHESPGSRAAYRRTSWDWSQEPISGCERDTHTRFCPTLSAPTTEAALGSIGQDYDLNFERYASITVLHAATGLTNRNPTVHIVDISCVDSQPHIHIHIMSIKNVLCTGCHPVLASIVTMDRAGDIGDIPRGDLEQ